MRNTAIKRHNDWRKAIRKRRITRHWGWSTDYYDNLHQYSKNKIHCSCALCRSKTNNKKQLATWRAMKGKKNWSIADRRKIEEMIDQLLDNEENL